jgi:glucose-1-phosphate thymidylyltransferase
MKGIILAGGRGTRFHPATLVVSKQLLPVYDKPMVYYPLSTLMYAGIRDILVITTPQDAPLFQQLLGDGSQWGISLTYAAQPEPAGIAQAFIIGESFIGNDAVCLILGDNILHGDGLVTKLQQAGREPAVPTIFGYYVANPEQYGVIQFDAHHQPVDIIEKPDTFISNYAAIGLYFYDHSVVQVAKSLTPSKRGELEITDVNRHYLKQGKLHVEKLGRGVAWLDTGTPQSLLSAAQFIQVLEERQGLKVGSPEEVAWRMGYIPKDQLQRLAHRQISNSYSRYLLNLTEDFA